MRDADNQRDNTDQDVLGAFYIIGKEPTESMSGWIAIEEQVDEFLETVFEEMEYTLQVDIKDQNMYNMFYVDTTGSNNLRPIIGQSDFDTVRKLDRILVMIIHKDIDTARVTSHPRYQDWLEETDV